MRMNQNSQQTIPFNPSQVVLRRRLTTAGRRGGFMAFGLILCLILILTVAAVLWSYQYFTIQNLELEYAVRSALSASVEDETLDDYLQDSEKRANSTLQRVLDLTTKQQNRGSMEKKVTIKVERDASDGKAPILSFSQSRELGFTRGTFDEETREKAEGTTTEPKSFKQYYEISTDGKSFKKVYSVQ